jgi:hypothetical protein
MRYPQAVDRHLRPNWPAGIVGFAARPLRAAPATPTVEVGCGEQKVTGRVQTCPLDAERVACRDALGTAVRPHSTGPTKPAYDRHRVVETDRMEGSVELFAHEPDWRCITQC